MAKRSLLTDRLRFRSVVRREAAGCVARGRRDDQYSQYRVRPMCIVHRVASRVALSAFLAGTFLSLPARGEALSLEPPRYVVNPPDVPAPAPPIRVAAARANMGGGFIEFLFGGGGDVA